MCLLLCLFCAVLLGVLYLFFGAFELVFENNHGFNLWQVGLSFLGMSVGMIIGIGSNPLLVSSSLSCVQFVHALNENRWNRQYLHILRQYRARTGVENASEPEFRLPPAVGGAPLVTIGLLIFAWTMWVYIRGIMASMWAVTSC